MTLPMQWLIYGLVQDDDSNNIPNVTVYLENLNSGYTTQTTTDENGRYLFDMREDSNNGDNIKLQAISGELYNCEETDVDISYPGRKIILVIGDYYPLHLTLYDNIIEENTVSDRWVYAISLNNTSGAASSNTDINGETTIGISGISNNGQIIRVYDGTFNYEYILDTSVLPKRLDLYQNASNSNDVVVQSTYYGNEVYLTRDSFVGKDVNIKTMDY